MGSVSATEIKKMNVNINKGRDAFRVCRVICLFNSEHFFFFFFFFLLTEDALLAIDRCQKLF